MVIGCDDSGPQYLSSRSSDVILSDIRPIQLKVEALRSINTFLDEFLWNILSNARSLVTDRIKAGVLKTLPTSLGKAALLEAEVELKAYYERNSPNLGASDAQDFLLQWSYELLRLKCEAYSTLNDTDEDSIAEARLGVRMREAGHLVPPQAALVAPAALYLTAVLEHVCEHILSNISRVVSRDSSRTSATLNDLFVAICEDVTLYGTFKAMKVYDQIDNLIKTSRPRRSKSIGRAAVEKLMTASHHSETSLNSGSAHSRNRGSIGDAKAIPGFPADQRSGSRTSMDHPASTHKRAESAASGCSESLNNSSVELEERMLNDEFDELMRSGTTMKVSLTPDRLKTMEVFKEEKSRRVGRKSSNKRGAEELSRLEKRSLSNRPPLPRPVDVIAEDDEETTSTFFSSNNGRVYPMNSPHKRAGASQFDMTGRARAISTSQIQTGATHLLPRKTSSLSAKASIPVSQKRFVHGPTPLELSDKLNRTRKISDMDPDDIVNDSDDEKSESHTLSNFKTPRPPKLSKGARDLIEFLDQGPPTDFTPPLPPQSPAASPSLKAAGRFQRMMSRLTGGSSSEKLREESAKLRKTPVVSTAVNTTNGTTNHPQTPVKKVVPTVVIATPPPRMQPTSQQVTPPKSPTFNHDPPRLVQRKTSVRKKVPPLNPELEMSVHSPQSPSVSRVLYDEQTRPSTLPNGNGQPNGINEAHKPAQLVSPEPEPRPRASADTIASDEKIIFRRPAPTPPTKNVVEVTAPAPLPVTIQPPSPSQDAQLPLDAAHARSLRQLMSTATSADECRVLVDMFLARVGFPVDRSTDADPYPSPISSTDPSDVDLESSLIEALLGGDSSSVPSTAVHSAQPSEAGQADESEVGISDAETCDEVIDSPTQHSPSRIVRDARVNRPLPPASRLLAVA